jgi:hypothetical protein
MRDGGGWWLDEHLGNEQDDGKGVVALTPTRIGRDKVQCAIRGDRTTVIHVAGMEGLQLEGQLCSLGIQQKSNRTNGLCARPFPPVFPLESETGFDAGRDFEVSITGVLLDCRLFTVAVREQSQQ